MGGTARPQTSPRADNKGDDHEGLMLHARPLVASGGDAQQDLLNLPEGIMTHFKRADRWIEAKGGRSLAS